MQTGNCSTRSNEEVALQGPGGINRWRRDFSQKSLWRKCHLRSAWRMNAWWLEREEKGHYRPMYVFPVAAVIRDTNSMALNNTHLLSDHSGGEKSGGHCCFLYSGSYEAAIEDLPVLLFLKVGGWIHF